MGIRGLTTFIDSNSDLFLQSYQLHNTHLVIDGNSLASCLYRDVVKKLSAFGGDYDEYYEIVQEFFKTLKMCNITPIVIFDGGYERRKLKTVRDRSIKKLQMIRNCFNSKFSRMKFFPIFMKQTFWDVLHDLGIKCIQCSFEADGQIAAVARRFNYPVLSLDSDFYLYDVLYIPFSSLMLEPIEVDEPGKKKSYYLECSLYEVNYFLNEFEGVEKELLPLLAAVAGNDYSGGAVFKNFMNRISLPKKKNMKMGEKRILGLMNWLKGEDYQSAVSHMLKHMKKKRENFALQSIKKSMKDYNVDNLTSIFEFVQANEFTEENEILVEKEPDEDSNLKKPRADKLVSSLPSKMLHLYHQCKISSFIMDMITLNSYYAPFQVENTRLPSANEMSFPIINAIYGILTYFTNSTRKLRVHVKNKFRYVTLKFKNDCLADFNVESIYEGTNETKMDFIYHVLNMTDDDRSVVEKFDENWHIFIIAFIYWTLNVDSSAKTAHTQAILLSAVANQIVQKKVGYYEKRNHFVKSKGARLKKLQKEKADVVKANHNSFAEVLGNVTELDCLNLTEILLPVRKTMEESLPKCYSVQPIHLFASFQSCLYHLMQLNAVLSFPFKQPKVSEFYSGTLVYNAYLYCKQRYNFTDFLLKDKPSIANVYNFISVQLDEYLPKQRNNVKKRKCRKEKKMKCEVAEEDEVVVEDLSDSDGYEDEDNPFSLLRKNTLQLSRSFVDMFNY